MSRPRGTFADPEADVVDALDVLLVDVDASVVVAIPGGWVPSDGSLVQVGWDATQTIEQVVAFATVRVSVWGAGKSDVKDLALLVHGRLLTEPEARPLTGPFPTRDPQNHAEVVSFTVRWAMRATPIP